MILFLIENQYYYALEILSKILEKYLFSGYSKWWQMKLNSLSEIYRKMCDVYGEPCFYQKCLQMGLMSLP